jgi:hypothetical protein
VIDVCYELQQFNFQRYVPWYYNKETVQNIWNQTSQVTSCRVLLLRTPNKMSSTYQIQILSCVKALEDKKKRIRNNVDEAEAGAAVVMCYKCLSTGHTYKRCTATSYACNAPPTGGVGSLATLGPSQAPSGRGRGCGRRTNVGFR